VEIDRLNTYMRNNKFEEISMKHYQEWYESNYEYLYNRSPFHHPAWLNSVARGVGFGTYVIGIYDGRELVGAIPGFLTRRGPFKLFGSPLPGTMTSYLGLVGSDNFRVEDEIVELGAHLEQYFQNHLHNAYCRVTLRDAPADYPLQLPSLWEQERPRSYRLDLSPGEDELWSRVKSDCRRNIKRAMREQIEIYPLEDAKLFFNTLERTFRRHGTTSWHKERFFSILLSELVPRDLLWAWGAKYQGETIAVGLFYHDETEMHFISGASLPKYGNLPTSYLLHWHAITVAVSSGLKIFNSEASRVPSVDKFKESFRPNLERRYTLVRTQNYARYAQKLFKFSSSSWRGLKSKVVIGK
jgi:hypothetical protein